MPKFIVDIERIQTQIHSFEVEAGEIWAAEEKAFDMAVISLDWDKDRDADYNIMFSQTKDE